MRIVLFCATHRGYEFLKKLSHLVPRNTEIIVFSCNETAGEPPFVKKIQEFTRARGGPFFIEHAFAGKRWRHFFASKEFDLILAVSWRYIIPEKIYSAAQKGAFVFHDSLLPKYRGFSPTVRAIINGETATGVTLFHMAEKVDAGDIVDQVRVPISPDETIDAVLRRVTRTYLKILEKNFPALLSGKAPRRRQNHARATYFPPRKPQDNRINWSDSTENIYNLIRAVTCPYPGAFTRCRGRKLYVWSARRLRSGKKYPGNVPGHIAGMSARGAVVLTGDGAILLTRVQFKGQKPGSAAGVLRQVHTRLGEA